MGERRYFHAWIEDEGGRRAQESWSLTPHRDPREMAAFDLSYAPPNA